MSSLRRLILLKESLKTNIRQANVCELAFTVFYMHFTAVNGMKSSRGNPEVTTFLHSCHFINLLFLEQSSNSVLLFNGFNEK